MPTHSTKKKIFIITFIVIILLLVIGFFLLSKTSQTPTTAGTNIISKIFEPLLSSRDRKNVDVIDQSGSKTNSIYTNKINVQAQGNIPAESLVRLVGVTENGTPIIEAYNPATDNLGSAAIVAGIVPFGVTPQYLNGGSYGEILTTKIVSSEAKENINKNSLVYLVSVTPNGVPVVANYDLTNPALAGKIPFGTANQNIKTGERGDVTIGGGSSPSEPIVNNEGGKNTTGLFPTIKRIAIESINNSVEAIWKLLNSLVKPKPPTSPKPVDYTANNITPTFSCDNKANNPPACTTFNNKCLNNAENPPLCTTIKDKCINGAINPPLCTVGPDNKCLNGADNPMACTTIGGKCLNGAENPPLCTTFNNKCLNGADNPNLCTTFRGKCLNGAENPPLCTTLNNKCLNGADNPTLCTTISGKCINGAENPPLCTTIDGGKCLNGATNPPVCDKIPSAFCSANTITKVLSAGNPANDPAQVKSLQLILSKLNSSLNKKYLSAGDIESDITSDKGISGGFGTNTKRAVMLFQSDNKTQEKYTLTPTGTVDYQTMEVINNKCTEIENPNNFSVCNDEIDNDKDEKADQDDPECHSDGNVDNEDSYVPTHYSESFRPTPECSNGINDDEKEGADKADPECHTDGNINNDNSYTPNHYSESIPASTVPQCKDGADNDNKDGADKLDPSCHTDFNKNNDSSYDGEIRDEGREKISAQCGNGEDDDGKEGIDYEDPDCHTDKIASNWNSYSATIASEKGGIETPGKTCKDPLAINFPDCTINSDGECLNGAIDPPACKKLCENDATNPPLCTTKDGKCLNGATNPEACTNTGIEINKCQWLDQFPLEFNDDEKARLAELLRKFYLLAPTLKTEDDITMLYSEIDRYKQLLSQTVELTKQCYLETSYTEMWLYTGNPNPTAGMTAEELAFCRKNQAVCNNDIDFCSRNPGVCSKEGWAKQSDCDKNKASCEGKDIFNDKYQPPITPILNSSGDVINNPIRRWGNRWFKPDHMGTYVDESLYKDTKLNNTEFDGSIKSFNDAPYLLKTKKGDPETVSSFITSNPPAQGFVNPRDFALIWNFSPIFDLNAVMLKRLTEFESVLNIW